MKHILLFILFIASAFAATAQGHRFADTTAQWNVIHYEPGGSPQMPPSYFLTVHYVQSDTSIEGHDYQIISGKYFRKEGNTVITRINSIDRKAYEFGHIVGDTIFNLYRINRDSLMCIVDSVSIVNLGHPREKVSLNCGGYVHEQWVEGIGAINFEPIFLNNAQYVIATGTDWLQCYFENGVRLYHDSAVTDTCSWRKYTDISDVEVISASIYPNPTADKLTLTLSQYPQPNTAIMIHDCLGRTVKQEELLTTTQQIEIANLPNGLYTYAIVQGNIKQASGKIIISK